jgi:hypothetical protein
MRKKIERLVTYEENICDICEKDNWADLYVIQVTTTKTYAFCAEHLAEFISACDSWIKHNHITKVMLYNPGEDE